MTKNEKKWKRCWKAVMGVSVMLIFILVMAVRGRNSSLK